MKPASGGSTSAGLVLSIAVLIGGWVAIIWVTRRAKRSITEGEDRR